MHIYRQRYYLIAVLSILAMLSLLLFHAESRAHGLEYSVSEIAGRPIVSFKYSGGSPASYTEVKIWSPANDSIEFQNGRTDKNGRFSFVPDLEGMWRIALNDGMGHALTVDYNVTTIVRGTKDVVNSPVEQNNTTLYAVLGCSLLMNAGGIIGRLRKMTLTACRRPLA